MDDQSRSSAPVESLVSRLDQFDLRLRQIEEKQKLLPAPDCYFTADVKLLAKKRGGGVGGGQHRRYTSLSAMHDLEVKDALLDRLHMLETRIRQLSLELDKDIGGCGGGGGTSAAETVVRAEKNKESGAARSWRSVVSFKSGARDQLPTQKPIVIKVKELEKAVGAAEKAVGAACQNERRRAERAWLYRRWLTVGC